MAKLVKEKIASKPKSPKQKLKKKAKKSVQKSTSPKNAKKLTKSIKATNIRDISEQVTKTDTRINYKKWNLDEEQIKNGVNALLQYNEKHKSTDLFKGQLGVYAQVTCVRIPSCPTRKFRVKLKHPLITNDNEICLIVSDLKRGRKVDHQETIDHYEEILREQNVTCIKRVLPIRQIRVEYDQFELKRRLCGYYDCFLVDGRVSGHALHLLGNVFAKKRKQPVPIQITNKNLNQQIANAMSKTEIEIHSKGDTYIVQIGNTDMTAQQITENMESLVRGLVAFFPGNWPNIRSLHVKTDKSIAIPVYYTLKNPNKVPTPTVTSEMDDEKITGELSTTNFEVTVHKDGKVALNDPRIKSKTQMKKLEPKIAKKKKLSKQLKAKKLKNPSDKIKQKLKKKVKGIQKEGKVKAEIETEVKVKVEKIKKEGVKKVKKEKLSVKVV